MKVKGRKKFRNKVLLIFILVALLPLLIVSASSLFIVVKTRQQNILELQNLAINSAEDKLVKYLNEKMEGFHLVVSGSSGANGVSVNNLEAINPNNLIFLIKSVKETAGDIDKINFINKQGDIISQINNNNDIILKKYYSSGTSLFYESKIKTALKIGENQANMDYFQKAISGNDYFGSLEFINGQPIIRLASQIENQDKKIIGVISAELNLKPISAIVDEVRLGEQGYVYIVDNNGRLIAGTNIGYARIGDNLSGLSLIRETIKSGQKGNLTKYETYTNRVREKIIFAGRALKSMNWFVISEWPKKDAFYVINNLLNLMFLITVSTLLLIIVLGWFFARQIEKPLKSLGRGAKHISEGDFDYRLRIRTGDEFEALGNRFNQMIKILKENQKLRDEFVFIAAHELGTPVTAIKGYVSMILDKTFGDIPDKVRKNLLIINQSNERLVQLVQDLLEVARSEAGKMKIEIENICINKDMEIVINELKSLSNKKGINIIYKKPDKNLIVKADSYKLKEVLTNLIGNAIKYTLDIGDIIIKHEIKDGYLWTHIKDHGIGMSEEELKQLFSKFYRAQNDKTKNIEGTGLGLFICKEIIERLGGKIQVKSEKDMGSTFSFSLNLAD